MGASVDNAASRFLDQVGRLCQRAEHCCARTRSEKEAACQVRYEADNRRGRVEPRGNGQLSDKVLDDAPNSWITTTFIDGRLASTLRIHVAVGENAGLPSLSVFSDAFVPHFGPGRTVVDQSRLAIRLEHSRRFPEMPYVALRPAWLAAEHFDADFVVATIPEDHLAFYGRVFGYEQWREPRDCPHLNSSIVCAGLDFRRGKGRVEASHPFLCSTSAEREALFARWEPKRTSLAFG